MFAVDNVHGSIKFCGGGYQGAGQQINPAEHGAGEGFLSEAAAGHAQKGGFRQGPTSRRIVGRVSCQYAPHTQNLGPLTRQARGCRCCLFQLAEAVGGKATLHGQEAELTVGCRYFLPVLRPREDAPGLRLWRRPGCMQRPPRDRTSLRGQGPAGHSSACPVRPGPVALRPASRNRNGLQRGGHISLPAPGPPRGHPRRDLPADQSRDRAPAADRKDTTGALPAGSGKSRDAGAGAVKNWVVTFG